MAGSIAPIPGLDVLLAFAADTLTCTTMQAKPVATGFALGVIASVHVVATAADAGGELHFFPTFFFGSASPFSFASAFSVSSFRIFARLTP